MFIQTETTPNPLTLKFIPGVPVKEGEPVAFTSRSNKVSSPLAEVLLEIPGVTGVFLGADFITITKSPEERWDVLKPLLLTTIMEHFVAGKPVMAEGETFQGQHVSAEGEEEDPIIRQIKELIDTRVRPAVAQDGGDIIFRGFENGIVKLELHGSCSGCPSSTVTLKNGVENMLKYYVPEIVAVEAVA